MKALRVAIEQDLARDPTGNVWAWSLNYGDELAGIGYGHDYESCVKLSRKALRRTNKWLAEQNPVLDFTRNLQKPIL